MRDAWQRGDPALALNREALARIVAQLVPGARLHRAAPVSGGLANTTWRLELATAERLPTVTLLRFWQRDPAAAVKELTDD